MWKLGVLHVISELDWILNFVLRLTTLNEVAPNVRKSWIYSEVRILLISCLVPAASRCLHASALSYVFLADVALVPLRGRRVVVRPKSAAERSARRQRDDEVLLAGRSHYRTHVVICSKQKRKKRETCRPKKATHLLKKSNLVNRSNF